MEQRSCLPLEQDASRRVKVIDRNRTIHEFWPRMSPRGAFVANLHVRQPTGPADHQTLGASQLIGTQFNRRNEASCGTSNLLKHGRVLRHPIRLGLEPAASRGHSRVDASAIHQGIT